MPSSGAAAGSRLCPVETLGSASDTRRRRARSMMRKRPAGAEGGAGHAVETLHPGGKTYGSG